MAARLLVVDDNRLFLESIRGFLASQSDHQYVQVGSATSGEEGLKLCAELNPDLVLVDVSMPGMNGLDATRLIKSMVNAPRVIVVSVHDGQEYQRAAFGAGADGFVSKVDLFNTLVPTLNEVTARGQA